MSSISKELLSQLPENVRVAMQMRYGESNATYKDIGAHLGVTRERARQLIAKGDNLIFKLRQSPHYTLQQVGDLYAEFLASVDYGSTGETGWENFTRWMEARK